MKNYNIELEIHEDNGSACHGMPSADFAENGACIWMHGKLEVGQKFQYPDDLGKLCPWLVYSATSMVRALENGGPLPQEYRVEPHEKRIDLDGVTTEYVRCSNATSTGVILKITRIVIPPE